MAFSREDYIALNMTGDTKVFSPHGELDARRARSLIEADDAKRDLEKELSLIKKHGVRAVTFFDTAYPPRLKQIHSPPLVLYLKGEMPAADEYAVAVVGSRLASIYGMNTAGKFGYDLASCGVCVASGLARGVDSAAHRGALKARGRTVAVLGNGLRTAYPPENGRLAADIVEGGGALISEFPMDTPPAAYNFPRRNRIISGLSLAVVIVEAAKNSGALITANYALEQNREVFAVPGKVDAPTSFGANELIKNGAHLAQNAYDVMGELGLTLKRTRRRGSGERPPRIDSREALSKEESIVYNGLSGEPRYIDDIAEGAALSAREALDALLRLQFKKLVRELPGKNFVKV